MALGIMACSSSGSPKLLETCQDIVKDYENFTAAASTCDPTEANPCPVLLPIVIIQDDADGGQTNVNLAADCNAAFNAIAGDQLESLYAKFQTMNCQPQPVPLCQTGPNQCISNPTGGPGYSCFPN